MLRALHLRDFVLVDQADIGFEPGFTVLSGETGAGKSILVDALSLALGGRGDAGVVRSEADKADISAVFQPPPALAPWLRDNDHDPDDDLILRRVIDRQGRSRAYVNGVPVPVAQLRSLGEQLVDIHGQHAHQSLLETTSQRRLLDAQGGLQALAEQVAQAWRHWKQAEQELAAARDSAQARQDEASRLQWQLSELDALRLEPNEWEAVQAEHQRLAHAQGLLDGAAQALSALDGEQGAASAALHAAAQALRPLLRHDARLQGTLEAIESAHIACGEAVSDLNSYLDRLEPDPERLARVEQRLSALFEAARRFQCEPGELPAFQERIQAQLDALQAGIDVGALAEQAAGAEQAYREQAGNLSRRRRATAKTLSAQVTKAMQTLAMAGGSFSIQVEPAAAGPHGLDAVTFLVAGHEGAPVRPLGKVASGGELARLSLALSVIASQAARVPTLIFDEVDTGIGGAVADVVGQLLRDLGTRHQVLCVTHLPQVAARGNHHYGIRKDTADGRTLSAITLLKPEARVGEIARMLGGLTITDTTRRHAREMLRG